MDALVSRLVALTLCSAEYNRADRAAEYAAKNRENAAKHDVAGHRSSGGTAASPRKSKSQPMRSLEGCPGIEVPSQVALVQV